MHLLGLSDQFEFKKDWKKCIKSSEKHYPVHTKQFCEKINFTLWSYHWNRHINLATCLGHIPMLDSTHLFVVHLFFQKVAKIYNFWKVANFCNHVNPLLLASPWVFIHVAVRNSMSTCSSFMNSTISVCFSLGPNEWPLKTEAVSPL